MSHNHNPKKRKSSQLKDKDKPPRKRQKIHNETVHKLRIKIMNNGSEFNVKSLLRIPYFQKDRNKIIENKIDGNETKYTFKSGSTTVKFSLI